jgi:orotate phosphoribosyltransferase
MTGKELARQISRGSNGEGFRDALQTKGRKELASRIYHVSHLTGSFKLRSGQVSSEYFDKYLFEADPKLLKAIADEMAKLIPAGTQVLAGLEMGAIPIATALSLKTGLPVVFVRKQAKDYGTSKVAEGADVRGRQVCVIEDVVTTGGQIVMSVNDLKGLGAVIDTVLCVIERDIKGRENLKKEGLALRSLFTMEELTSAGTANPEHQTLNTGQIANAKPQS